MITFLIQSGEYMDLTALDSQGKRAIDLCPYSSPIFKTIRNLTKQQIRTVAEPAYKESKGGPMTN